MPGSRTVTPTRPTPTPRIASDLDRVVVIFIAFITWIKRIVVVVIIIRLLFCVWGFDMNRFHFYFLIIILSPKLLELLRSFEVWFDVFKN